MKKKLFAGICLALGITTLAGCSQASQKLQFNTNWSLNTMNDTPISTAEVLTYDVNFVASSFMQGEHFSVEYCKDIDGKTQLGSYVTTLEGKDGGYLYTTTLSVPVRYSFGGETAVFTDTMTSVVEFKSAKHGLTPISSTKTVISHSPRNVEPTSLSGCYIDYQYTLTTTYNSDCTAGETLMIDNSQNGTLYNKDIYPSGKKSSFEIDITKYSYLDNEQLLFALRGLSNTAISTTKSVNVYNASLDMVQLVTMTPSSSDSDKYGFTINGTKLADDVAIDYTPVTIALPKGATQTLHYASTTDDANNIYRNVLLYMRTPVAYSIGYLEYTLKDAVFANN